MKRFLALFSIAALLVVCPAFAGKKQGGGGGGKGAGKAARAGGGGGHGMGGGAGRGAGMGQRNFGGRNSAGQGRQGKAMHHENAARSGRNAGQGKMGNFGKAGGSTDRGLHARSGAGLRNGRAAGLHHQALHSHAGFNRGRGIARVNRVHVQRYSVVVRNYHVVHHDRFWWRTHYSRIVLVGGGWYYWDAGYWYPAWGYDPGFTAYAYNGPIYTYDNLPPDEVIVNIQTELQFQGYYDGPIDGQLGPETRAAIGDYQRDHNLEITQAADEPTVDALGLV